MRAPAKILPEEDDPGTRAGERRCDGPRPPVRILAAIPARSNHSVRPDPDVPIPMVRTIASSPRVSPQSAVRPPST